MELDVTRRDFLRTAGVALAGAVFSASSVFGQEKKDEKKEEKKAEEPKTEPPKAPKAEDKTSDDADWDAAWKSSGTEETRTCPQCGAAMYRQGRTWTCNNCGYSYVE